MKRLIKTELNYHQIGIKFTCFSFGIPWPRLNAAWIWLYALGEKTEREFQEQAPISSLLTRKASPNAQSEQNPTLFSLVSPFDDGGGNDIVAAAPVSIGPEWGNHPLVGCPKLFIFFSDFLLFSIKNSSSVAGRSRQPKCIKEIIKMEHRKVAP